MGLTLITAPDLEPITLDEAKAHIRVTHDAEDALIQRYLRSAVRWCEAFTHRKFIAQTWDMTLDRFPIGFTPIWLPFGSAQSVTRIRYYDTNGALQTLTGPSSGSPAGTDYQEDLSGDTGARILPNPDDDWPDPDEDRLAAVTVRWVAGFGTDPEDVPDDIGTAILYRFADLYEYRGSMDGQGTHNAKLELGPWVLPLPMGL